MRNLCIFTILVAVISYVKTKGDDQTTADGYFLAGRGLPGVVIAGSLLLTNLSAEQLVGTNGQTWAIGMSPMAFEVMAATALIVLALFAAPRYLKSGITTIPQLLGERYDRPTKLWFSIAYIILYLFVQIPVILYSGSLVFENIFNLSGILGITKFQSIVILCILITIIGSIYAIFGGLKAVAVSDTINGVGLLIGGLMIPFLALNVLGHASGSESSVAIMDGVRYLIHNHADMLNSIAPAQSEAPAVPWPTVFLGLVFLGFQSWCTHQSFIQRVLAAENLKEAQKGALYCAFLKILGFMFLALPGVIAYAIFNIEGTQVSMMDDAYPALITRVVPQPVMGFFAAVMFGAILSSFNSVLNSVNTMREQAGFGRQEHRHRVRHLLRDRRSDGLLLPCRSQDLPRLVRYAGWPAGSVRRIRRLLLQLPAEVQRALHHGVPHHLLRRLHAAVPELLAVRRQ